VRLRGYSLKYFFQKKIKILAYHSVCKTVPNKYSLTVEQFRTHLEYLHSHRFNVLSLEQLLSSIHNNTISSKAILITFDDAYCDLIHNALPLLQKYQFPSLIFVPFDYMGKGDGFSFQECRPDLKIMSIKDIEKIKTTWPLVTFGSHTMKHRDLTSLDENSSHYEIYESLSFLKNNLQEKLLSLAYPFGMFNENIKKEVSEAGYHCAFAFGNIMSNTISTNIYELKREVVLNGQSLKRFAIKVNPVFDLTRKLLKIG